MRGCVEENCSVNLYGKSLSLPVALFFPSFLFFFLDDLKMKSSVVMAVSETGSNNRWMPSQNLCGKLLRSIKIAKFLLKKVKDNLSPSTSTNLSPFPSQFSDRNGNILTVDWFLLSWWIFLRNILIKDCVNNLSIMPQSLEQS